MPYLDRVPEQLASPRLSRDDAARTVAHYLAGDPEPLIVADWPEDIAHVQRAAGHRAGHDGRRSARYALSSLPLTGFSTAANSKVPHNALHDARALRDHILGME